MFSGKSIARLEDARFLTGRGNYVADMVPADALHAVILRSPYAHAMLLGINAEAARAMPGVVGVFTAADLAADNLAPLPCTAVLASVAPMIVPPRPTLAIDHVRHLGEAVALVIATSAEAARDAAEAIEVDYDALPVVIDGASALATAAPQIWPQAPGNEAFRFLKGDRAATDAAFAAADHIISLDLFNNRVHAAPIEPRAALARYDGGQFELIFTGMGVHGIRRQLATVFGLPEEAFHLVCPDVGGGFGAKNFLFPEYVLALWAARRLGRSIAWQAEPSEEFAAAVHGRDLRAKARLALAKDGRFLALEISSVADMGAYLSAVGPHCPTNAFSTAMGGVYVIPAMHLEVRGAFTNSLPVDAYRGAGKPEANYIIERLVDKAARRLGHDPSQLRAMNMLPNTPHRTAMGMAVDGGRFAANLAVLAQVSDAAGFAARRDEATRRGVLLGRGIACFLETARGAPGEWASVAVDASGDVTAAIGTHSNGQGHETSYAQIVADRLGLTPAEVRILQADTGLLPNGNGHGGARSLHLGGGALVLALDTLTEKARLIAAHLLQADPATLRFTDGGFTLTDGARSITLAAIAAAAEDPANLPDGMAPGLSALGQNTSDLVTFPNGCQAAEVEIDPETGYLRLTRYFAVDDYGRLVNPRLTEGQVQGGIAQGIGQAMLEDIIYDRESGQLLTGSLMDYALPRADDLPPIEVILEGTPTAANPLGVKGSGQAGAIAGPQTIMNAIADALALRGATTPDMPATPERIWRALRQASLQQERN
jgi:carbon-monoxide dehydrogenase large subunit